jgi:uridine kinase
MRSLFLNPLFGIGLLIRLALIYSLAPSAVVEWYVPFLESSIVNLGLDPWAMWQVGGNTPAAFPYGYAMWVTFLPLTIIAKLLHLSPILAYAVTLLICDVLMLLTLQRLLPNRSSLLLATYWLSPIVIVSGYVLGLNDVIPVLLLSLSIYFIRNHQPLRTGALCAAAISAKLSMVVALPFFLIYFYNNRPLQQYLNQFFAGFAIVGILLFVPFLFSENATLMLMSNPEMGKIYNLTLDLGNHTALYIVPLIYLLMLYYAWRIRRLNFELFQSIVGLAFLMIVLTTPASPGWFVWTVPFLVFYQAMSGRMAITLSAIFSGLYVISTLINSQLRLYDGGELYIQQYLQLNYQLGLHTRSLMLSGMVAIGIVLAIRIWRETINRNDYFRLSRKPFVIGIAGDSGAGKDTFADSITGLFGTHSVVKLSGDDYHNWDRQKPMWQVMTHLNPMANDLEGFCNDLIALTDGKSIVSRHYNHQTGKRSKPHLIASNDFIIASGLHALYLPLLRECYNLKIYLDINEALRRYFKLQRDVKQRGHTMERVLSSLQRREPDSERFISPQAQHADLILSLQPIHQRVVDELDDAQPLRLKLVVRTRQGFNELSLTRVLVGVCGLHVDIEHSDDGTELIITIEGETSADDIAMATQILCPRILEFLDIQPIWQAGMIGLMQLITLSHINQALTKRII